MHGTVIARGGWKRVGDQRSRHVRQPYRCQRNSVGGRSSWKTSARSSPEPRCGGNMRNEAVVEYSAATREFCESRVRDYFHCEWTGDGRMSVLPLLVEVFPDEKIVVSLIRQLSWAHVIALIPLKEPLQRDFYIHMYRAHRRARPNRGAVGVPGRADERANAFSNQTPSCACNAKTATNADTDTRSSGRRASVWGRC